MGSNLAVLALVVSLLAVGAAGYVFLQEREGPLDVETRIQTLETQIARLESALEDREEADRPTLLGPSVRRDQPRQIEALDAPDAPGDAPSDPTEGALAEPISSSVEALRELVDEAVDRKAIELRTMENKKPSIDVFANTLELTDTQRQAAEQEIVRSQGEIKAILETPAQDGTYFMDELVEVLADGVANPGKNPGRGMKLFGRLLTENVPGSNETYAVRTEAVKQRLRETFKRNWTPEQFTRFHEWKMDPTEVRDIPGSPYKEIETRVIERARDLGADIPEPEAN